MTVAEDASERANNVVLKLCGVSKTYVSKPPVTALCDVNLEFATGEAVAIVGPSASGKTTLMSIMGLLSPPTDGRVLINQIDTVAITDDHRSLLRSQTIGFVFQHFHLLPSLTAIENVELGMLYQGLSSGKRKERANKALETVGLSKRKTHRPGELSGGEQQRVAIARAISGEPSIILADEPTGALDQSTGRIVIDLLVELSLNGTAVIAITHDQLVADRFGRQVSLLDGSVVSDSGLIDRQDLL